MTLDNVADIYPLSPLQLGMLYHTLAEPGSGVYVQQIVMRIRGPVDAEALRDTWSSLARRNTILRTAFLWDGLDAPVQVVRQKVDIGWTEVDWSSLDPPTFDRRLEEFLTADRKEGFDPGRAPLFRLRLIRSDSDQFVLVWSYHHILLDGWSTGIVLRELHSVYSSEMGAGDADLPPPQAYRAYVDHLAQGDPNLSEQFWTSLLADFSESTPLGFDRLRPVAEAVPVQTTELLISEELTHRLSHFARKSRVTLNTIVHGGWSLLLGICSGRSDVVYGFTITNRPPSVPGIERMVGLFINTLPARVRLARDLPIDVWIQEVQELLLDIQANGQTPLFEAKRLSGIPSNQPLFESLLVFENYPADTTPASRAFEIEDVRHFEQSNFPLALLFLPGDRLQVKVVYDSSRFGSDAIHLLLRHFESVLDRMTSGDAALVGDVRPPPTNLSILHGPALDSVGTLVHQQIVQNAAHRPDQIAVSCEGTHLSYGELSQKSASIAARLLTLKLKPSEPVCLALDRTVDMVAAILGVLRAGGAYVPVDPSSPPSRIGHLVEDCGARVLITDKGFLPTADISGLTTVVIQDVNDDTSGYTDPEVSPSDRAYILYTSGSTGQPKGVEVTHENLLSSTTARAQYYNEPPESFLLLSSYVFDSSVAGIFWTLCSGGKLVIPRTRLEQDIDALTNLIKEEAITHTLCLPTIYRLILEYAVPTLLSHLQTVIVAGEQCPPDVILSHFEVLPNTLLYNEYGPTEGTVWATVERFDSLDADVTIGQPIPGVSVYVCGEDLQPLPRGVSGEILLGGLGVTPGYLNQPELTAQNFISGIDGVSESRIYRTGDLARVRPDGKLEFQGRLDEQLKIRGHRIEPEEIEAVIHQHKSVHEAAVVALPRVEGAESSLRLVAFYTTRGAEANNSASEVDLRSFLSKRLPAHMVPAEYVPLGELPRTATGKTDRVKLRVAPTSETGLDTRVDRVPASDAERTLLEVWQVLFARDDISLTDNFFQMGGDSMLSIQMTSLSRHRGVSIRPQDIFEYPTIELLAARANGEVATDATQGIEVGESELLPIHHWFLENNGLSDHWNMSRLIPISSSVRSQDVQTALRYLIGHHDALRSRILEDDREWKLVIDSVPEEVGLDIVDVAGSTDTEKRDRLLDCETTMHSAIRLSTGECVKFALIVTDPSLPNLLQVVAHHAVVDIASWVIIEQDIDTLLRCAEEHREMVLPKRTTSVRQWAEVLRDHANTALVRKELSYWRSQSVGLRVPRGLANGGSDLHRDGASVRATADFDLSEFSGSRQTFDLRPHEMALSAVCLSLAEWMENPTVSVGIESSGRRQTLDPDVDLSRTVGWLTASYTVEIKAELAGAKSIVEHVERIAQQLRAIPGHGLGFGMLRYLAADSEVREALRPHSNPEIVFNYLGTMRSSPSVEHIGRLAASPEIARSETSVRPALLEIIAFLDHGKLVMDWRYNVDIHRLETIENLAGRAASFIEQFVDECRERSSIASTDAIGASNISQDDLDALLGSLR